MAAIILPADLPQAVRDALGDLLQIVVDGLNANASRVAPCLASLDPAPTPDQLAEAKLVLIGAVKRFADAGSGALQAQQAGPFGMTVDTRQRTGYNLWPTEITRLQDICKPAGKGKAFSVDTAPSSGSAHVPWCSLMMGATYCSCGVDIAGYPLYESGYET